MSEDLSQIAERTNMFLEAGQAAEVVARQLLESRQAVEEAARMVRKKNPRFALFCARGVSVRARGVISGVGDGVFLGGACPTPECGVAGGHRVHRYGGVCTLQP